MAVYAITYRSSNLKIFTFNVFFFQVIRIFYPERRKAFHFEQYHNTCIVNNRQLVLHYTPHRSVYCLNSIRLSSQTAISDRRRMSGCLVINATLFFTGLSHKKTHLRIREVCDLYNFTVNLTRDSSQTYICAGNLEMA